MTAQPGSTEKNGGVTPPQPCYLIAALKNAVQIFWVICRLCTLDFFFLISMKILYYVELSNGSSFLPFFLSFFLLLQSFLRVATN